MRLSKVLILASAALVGATSVANAVFVPWSNPNGTVPGLYSWSNGGSDNGLFGSPVVAGNSFTFFPSGFKAQTNAGVAQTTSDRLSFQVDVAPGAVDVFSVSVTELGDYGISNGGNVSALASLFVTNIEIPVGIGNPSTASNSFNRNLALGQNETGQWNITAASTLPNGWRRITVVLDNVLQASVPGSGSTALIEKKVQGVTITIDVPEPASISAALLGMGALCIRRRK